MDFDEFCTIIYGALPKTREITPDDRLASDLGLCSFDIMMIIAQLENHLEHSIEISNIEKNMTAGELFNLVVR